MIGSIRTRPDERVGRRAIYIEPLLNHLSPRGLVGFGDAGIRDDGHHVEVSRLMGEVSYWKCRYHDVVAELRNVRRKLERSHDHAVKLNCRIAGLDEIVSAKTIKQGR